MKLTIIETGKPPGALEERFPSYPDMFISLLGRADARLKFETVSVVDGAPPPDPKSCDAVLITGSPAGVYDPLPWMNPLRGFVREAAGAKIPMVGVCLGHQIIADALGGVVRKSDKGWGVGRHAYELHSAQKWMSVGKPAIRLAVSHQDQVIEPPRAARTLASCAHTEHAMLAYDDAPIVTIQGHPEFTDMFASALYGARRGKGLTDEEADAAIESLAAPDDNDLFAEWITGFLAAARR